MCLALNHSVNICEVRNGIDTPDKHMVWSGLLNVRSPDSDGHSKFFERVFFSLQSWALSIWYASIALILEMAHWNTCRDKVNRSKFDKQRNVGLEWFASENSAKLKSSKLASSFKTGEMSNDALAHTNVLRCYRFWHTFCAIENTLGFFLRIIANT